MITVFLLLILLLVALVAYRLYRFLRATDAPILKGKLHFNVRYKPGKKLDIYQPTRPVFAQSPVLVHFHGGGWLIGSKMFVNNARFHGAFNELRERGYAIVSPKYTLARKGRPPFPACLADAHDALAWMAENADRYGFDLKNVGVMGESAGAHIALMLAYGAPTEFASRHPLAPRFAVDVYGPVELYSLYRQLAPAMDSLAVRTQKWPALLRDRFNLKESLFGFDPTADERRTEAFAKQFSPLEKAGPDSPGTLIIHGKWDRLVPVSQSYLLQEKLLALGVPHQMHLLDQAGHAFRGASLAQRQQVQQWIVDFVQQHYFFSENEMAVSAG